MLLFSVSVSSIKSTSISEGKTEISYANENGYQEGWPQKIGGQIDVNPTFADIDNDGYLEILIGNYDASNQGLYIFNHDGTLCDGWPKTIGYTDSSPSVGDIDLDGDLEIIGALAGGDNCRVYAWHHDGSLVDGWPQKAYWITHSSPALSDLDNDGFLEIVVCDWNGTIYAWHYDGSLVEGWPVYIEWKEISSSPAIGDIDDDGDLEIIVETSSWDTNPMLYAFNHNGTTVDGWPISINGGGSSPALGDLDGDGYLEIVASSNNEIDTHTALVYVFNHDGSLVDGWPKDIGYSHSSPALGDIDDDGEIEIVIEGYYVMYAWNGDGSSVEGWPIYDCGHTYASSPALVDIDGDKEIEVIAVASHDKSKIYAWNHNGILIDGWPKIVDGYVWKSSPCLGDIDSDGDIEIALGCWDGKIYIWDLPGSYSSSVMEWPMFHHDLWHTGLYDAPVKTNPPNKPDKPSGPTSGKVGNLYNYSTSTIEPDEDQLYYLFEWGDGNESEWLGPYDSGEICETNHTWGAKDSYKIRVKAKDVHGVISKWSDPLVVSMPKYKSSSPFFTKIFELFPNILKALRNPLNLNCWS